MRRPWTLRLILAVAIAGFAGAIPAAGGQEPSEKAVEAAIVDFAFEPAMLEVQVGTKIRWKNAGNLPHVVTDRGGTFDTKLILPGRTGSVTFTVPGTYSYFCRVHPGQMNATLSVKGASEAAKVNRIEAKEFSFDPPELTVATGSLVLLANVGGLPHTMTANESSFDTGIVAPGPGGGKFAGTNVAVTLTAPGRFPFFCRIHPDAMKGVLTVSGPMKEPPPAASSAPERASVRMVDFAFRPVETSIAPGGEIVWTNEGSALHTATFNDVKLDTGVMKAGARATLKAPVSPGTYSYFCAVHPNKMRAAVVVIGPNMADPTGSASRGTARAGSTGGGPATGLSTLALLTGVAGAFLGGFGVSAFARRRHAG